MDRLIFANQLRGVAALCVVGSHWVGVYFGSPGAVSQATATPLLVGPIPSLFAVFAQPWLNFGPLGVALFFLISGLVIPISLGNHTRLGFLLARGLRIYPTYIASLALAAAGVWLSAHWWGLPMPFGRLALAINGLLIFDLLGRPTIDLVNWTLVVELKFYLLMMIAAPLIRRGDLRAVFAIAALTLGFNLIWSQHGFGFLQDRFSAQFGMTSLEALSVSFMLVGVVFSYHVRGHITSGRAVVAGLGLFGMFVAGWLVSVSADQFPNIAANYLYALLLFSVAYLARARFRPFAPLDFFARISFPLYAIHSLLGYCMLKLLMLSAGFAYLPALAVTFAVVVGVAAALSASVERWSIATGRRLAPRPVVAESRGRLEAIS